MKYEHILLSSDGPDCNVIKLKPPMVFTKDNADLFIRIFDKILEDESRKMSLENEKIKLTNVQDKKSTNIKHRTEEQIKSI